MTKKIEPENTGEEQADTTVDEQSGQDKATSEKTKVAYLVHGDGEDEEIADRFAEKVPDWDGWSPKEKERAVELMRAYWGHPIASTLTVGRNESGEVTLAPSGNATLHVLQNAETFASGSQEFVDARLGDLVKHFSANGGHGAQEGNLNASLAMIRGGNPQDTVQSTLLTQMVATHDAAMRALAMVGRADLVDHVSTFGNLAAKLLNVYARQAETLSKLQRGAEQTVRHVYVDARTQTAINCPPDQQKSEEQSHEQHEGGAFGSAMLGYDPAWNGVPMPCDEKEKSMPSPRRKGGGTARK